MTEIRFKNFVPKDEDLRPLWQEGVSVASLYRSVEKEMNQAIQDARNIAASKEPTKPNWDLKRDFERRNKKLGSATLKAIAKLNGSSDVAMEESSPRISSSPKSHKLSFPVEELSDDEDDTEFVKARREMGRLSKHDVSNE
jgi:hypothetical protein